MLASLEVPRTSASSAKVSRWENNSARNSGRPDRRDQRRRLCYRSRDMPDGVKVGVFVGNAETGRRRPLTADARQHWGTRAQRPRHIPLGRAARPESFLGPAPFLASELSANVTGSLIGRRLWRERGRPFAMAAASQAPRLACQAWTSPARRLWTTAKSPWPGFAR